MTTILYYSKRCGHCKELFNLVVEHKKNPSSLFTLVCIDNTQPPRDVDRVPMLRSEKGLLSDEPLYEYVRNKLAPQPFVPGTRYDESFSYVDKAEDMFDIQGLDAVYNMVGEKEPKSATIPSSSSDRGVSSKTFDQFMQQREQDLRSIYAHQSSDSSAAR